MANAEEAERLFTRASMATLVGFANVTSFRQLSALGIPVAEKYVHAQWGALLGELFRNPETENVYFNRADLERQFGSSKAAAAFFAQTTLSSHQFAINAASLVFAHSIVDAALHDHCRATAHADPAAWEPFVDQKQVKISEMKTGNYDALLWQKIADALGILERESMLTKVDRLFAVCRPEAGASYIHGFKFDRDRLARLDERRHDVVHRRNTDEPLPKGDEDVIFLRDTSNHLMAMVNSRFGLKLNPALIAQLKL